MSFAFDTKHPGFSVELIMLNAVPVKPRLRHAVSQDRSELGSKHAIARGDMKYDFLKEDAPSASSVGCAQGLS